MNSRSVSRLVAARVQIPHPDRRPIAVMSFIRGRRITTSSVAISGLGKLMNDLLMHVAVLLAEHALRSQRTRVLPEVATWNRTSPEHRLRRSLSHSRATGLRGHSERRVG